MSGMSSNQISPRMATISFLQRMERHSLYLAMLALLTINTIRSQGRAWRHQLPPVLLRLCLKRIRH